MKDSVYGWCFGTMSNSIGNVPVQHIAYQSVLTAAYRADNAQNTLLRVEIDNPDAGHPYTTYLLSGVLVGTGSQIAFSVPQLVQRRIFGQILTWTLDAVTPTTQARFVEDRRLPFLKVKRWIYDALITANGEPTELPEFKVEDAYISLILALERARLFVKTMDKTAMLNAYQSILDLCGAESVDSADYEGLPKLRRRIDEEVTFAANHAFMALAPQDHRED